MLDPRVLHQIDANAEHTHDRKPKMNKETRKTGTQKLILVLASWLPDSIPFLRSCFPDCCDLFMASCSSALTRHQREHFAHGRFEADEHRARHNRVPDIHVDQ